ncbi:YmfQ family protein [Paenibacillus whitsoniae]|uniref:DUF2313 domain-containing protein n=1 Tax=Paenibacillus whitsoniae TaxID=2496558 RepID=A0A430J7H5_9BACL|nr:YmfQ family protein [Paenibacillus whitsoniae]RTE05483.1 DUF2313 domain-containing protein [Paenibacillus whitsoniae]
MTMGDKVKGYVSPLYSADSTTGSLLDSGADELEAFEDDIADVLNQMFVNTATWGLTNWEGFFGIVTDMDKPIEQRRSVVKSKIRGSGTVTVDLMKNVAEAYANGTVDVTQNTAEYTVHVKFVSIHGVPANLADIEAALRDIVPAHLAIDFTFTYMTWGALDAKALTWGALDTANYTWDEFERLT